MTFDWRYSRYATPALPLLVLGVYPPPAVCMSPPCRRGGGFFVKPPLPSLKFIRISGMIFEAYNLKMKTVYTFVPSVNHVYPDHPERPARLDILEPQLKSFDAELITT